MTPEPKTLGLYSSMQGPAGMAAGAFMWFASKENLIEFIDLYPFFADAHPEQEEWEEAVNLADKFNRGEITANGTCEQINDILMDPYLDWIGSLEDLMKGKEKLAYRVISDFREDEETTGLNIHADEIKPFLEFIRDYGA